MPFAVPLPDFGVLVFRDRLLVDFKHETGRRFTAASFKSAEEFVRYPNPHPQRITVAKPPDLIAETLPFDRLRIRFARYMEKAQMVTCQYLIFLSVEAAFAVEPRG